MPYRDPAAQRAYMRTYQRAWYQKRRQEFFADKACLDCGAVADLCLDHRDPDDKVSSVIWSWREERRAAEIAKCDVRCQTCHRVRHAVEQRRHGLSRYRAGCRCAVCRAAKSAAAQRESRRQGEQRTRNAGREAWSV